MSAGARRSIQQLTLVAASAAIGLAIGPIRGALFGLAGVGGLLRLAGLVIPPGGGGREQKPLVAKLASGRECILREDPNFFIARRVVRDLVLGKRWHGRSLTVKTEAEPRGRTFNWKPRLNDFDEVERALRTAVPDLVNRE